MDTVAELRRAIAKLSSRQKLQLARWLRTQVNDRLRDKEIMAIAAEGARALDQREAAGAKGRKR
jgi:hypothetical protein